MGYSDGKFVPVGNMTLTQATVTCGTNSGAALAADANRQYALFINDSDTVVYLMIGAAAVANTGIRLAASGGTFEMRAPAVDTRAVNCINASGNKVLLVISG